MTRDRQQCIVTGFNALLFQYVLQALENVVRADPPEIEALRTRKDWGRSLLDLLGLGSRENEYHSRRRLFQDLQKSIPRFAGEHVCFVDDVNLPALIAGGRIHRSFAE